MRTGTRAKLAVPANHHQVPVPDAQTFKPAPAVLVAANAAAVIPRQTPVNVNAAFAGYLHERRMAHAHRGRHVGRFARVVHEERFPTRMSYPLRCSVLTGFIESPAVKWFTPLSRRRL
jgi:hypothetical protein